MTSGPDAAARLGSVGAPAGSRPTTLTSRLRRLGFADVTRSASLLDDKDLLRVVGPPSEDLLAALGATADPDLALLQLARLSTAAAGDEALCVTFLDVLAGEGRTPPRAGPRRGHRRREHPSGAGAHGPGPAARRAGRLGRPR
ncbi:hypothetical protein NKG05_25710 [Oerskovia sp. M15]